MKTCPACLQAYPDDVESCPHDGSRLSPEIRDERECPYCAERILKKARVCKHCGRDVEPMVNGDAPVQAPSPFPQQRIAEPPAAKGGIAVARRSWLLMMAGIVFALWGLDGLGLVNLLWPFGWLVTSYGGTALMWAAILGLLALGIVICHEDFRPLLLMLRPKPARLPSPETKSAKPEPVGSSRGGLKVIAGRSIAILAVVDLLSLGSRTTMLHGAVYLGLLALGLVLTAIGVTGWYKGRKPADSPHYKVVRTLALAATGVGLAILLVLAVAFVVVNQTQTDTTSPRPDVTVKPVTPPQPSPQVDKLRRLADMGKSTQCPEEANPEACNSLKARVNSMLKDTAEDKQFLTLFALAAITDRSDGTVDTYVVLCTEANIFWVVTVGHMTKKSTTAYGYAMYTRGKLNTFEFEGVADGSGAPGFVHRNIGGGSNIVTVMYTENGTHLWAEQVKDSAQVAINVDINTLATTVQASYIAVGHTRALHYSNQ